MYEDDNESWTFTKYVILPALIGTALIMIPLGPFILHQHADSERRQEKREAETYDQGYEWGAAFETATFSDCDDAAVVDTLDRSVRESWYTGCYDAVAGKEPQ